MEQAADAKFQEPVQGYRLSFVAVMLFAVLSGTVSHASDPHPSAVSGVVRDAYGVPQMGALIELIGVGGGGGRTAVTGLDGRFLFDHLLSGTYRLRASATLLRPSSTHGIRVSPGVQAVVNLTLANIYDAAVLLPAERRRSDEPTDDWMWTMRSAASRPVLRVVGGTGQAGEASGGRATVSVAAGVLSQNGGFGGRGVEDEVRTGYRSGDGTREATGVVRYGLVPARGSAAPIEMQAAVARQSSPWSRIATTVDYASDPEIQMSGTATGRRFLRIGSAETLRFGDTIEMQAGGVLESDQTPKGSLASRPFGRIRVHVGRNFSVGYAIATDRTMQGARDAELPSEAGAPEEASAMGHVGRIEHGRHDGMFLRQQTSTRSLSVAYYRDHLEQVPVTGSGAWNRGDSMLAEVGLAPGAMIDRSNGSFRGEGPGYRTQGVALTMSQAWAQGQWMEISVRSGAAMALAGVPSALPGDPSRLHVGHGVAVGVSSHNRIRRTGSDIRVSYQWQAQRLITPIDAFDALTVPAYLGISLRQRFPGHVLPRGAMLSVSAANVLRQGIRPVMLPDQSVLALAQELPTLQAGVGFNF